MFLKNFRAVLTIASFLLLFAPGAWSQDDDRGYRGRDDEARERPKLSGFGSRLWYGGGVGLNFFGYNNASIFSVGVSPMVGFKIIEPISVGPRMSFTFSSYKQQNFKALGLFDTEAGVFVRGRIYKGFFLQGELANEWTQQPDGTFTNNRLNKHTLQRFNQYLGAGYNFGNGNAPVGSEIGVYYNFAIAGDTETYENPVEYRFGITWRF